MLAQGKSDFFEKVKVVSSNSGKHHLIGEVGCVLGKSQNNKGTWSYVVSLYCHALSYTFDETELKTTGQFDRYENLYDGTFMRVQADEHGNSSIVES
jgi:hypothetical protein